MIRCGKSFEIDICTLVLVQGMLILLFLKHFDQ